MVVQYLLNGYSKYNITYNSKLSYPELFIANTILDSCVNMNKRFNVKYQNIYEIYSSLVYSMCHNRIVYPFANILLFSVPKAKNDLVIQHDNILISFNHFSVLKRYAMREVCWIPIFWTLERIKMLFFENGYFLL